MNAEKLRTGAQTMRRLALAMLTVAAVAMAACTAPPPPPPPTTPEPPRPDVATAGEPKVETSIVKLSGVGYEGVVVPAAEGTRFFHALTGESVEAWTPAQSDVEALEAALPGFLQSTPHHGRPDLATRVATYRRQYVGVVQGGRRLIYVNAFCDRPERWEREPVGVDDGGDCYFQVFWAPEPGAFERLMVNGAG